jgi:hypothetical protein
MNSSDTRTTADDAVGNGRVRTLSDALLSVEEILERYVVLPSEDHYTAVTLWVAHTYLFDLWDATMYLAITSPEKQSGKTRLLENLELLVSHPVRAEMASPAALYTIADRGGTMLLDELDAAFAAADRSESAQAIRGILNSGNRRGGYVPRVQMQGQTRTVERFKTFGPKALAGISSLPETLADRSIEVRMFRKTDDEKVEAFRMRPARVQASPVREELARVLTESRETIAMWRMGDHLDLEGMSDRQVEGWEPLLAIAGAAGRLWLAPVLTAATRLTAAARERETPEGALLLLHIREAFDAAGTDRLPTLGLLQTLRERDDGPWAKAFDDAFDVFNLKSAAELAKRVREYGVRPSRLRLPDTNDRPKGYLRSSFEEAWRRWLP